MQMNDIISKAALAARREQFKPGTRVELMSMSDPFSALKPGERGSVSAVDDIGTVFVKWDSGSTLGACYGADEIRKLTVIPAGIVDLVKKVRLLPGVPNMLSVKELFEFAMQQDDDYYPLCDYLFMHTHEYSRFIISGETEF
jgi:hypothetical protein